MAKRLPDQADSLIDGGAIPLTPILVGEQHKVSVVVEARRPPGVGEQDQAQQSGDVGVIGQQPLQHAGQIG